MEEIVEVAERVTDETKRCLPECSMTEYVMSVQTLPYDSAPYEKWLDHFNFSRDIIEMMKHPQ